MNDPYQGSVIILHGPPKVGKTLTAASFPGPALFIATEAGHKYIQYELKKSLVRLRLGKDTAIHKGTIYKFKNGWEKLMWLLEGDYIKRMKLKTLIVDSVGPLYQMCMDYVCESNGYEHPQDGGHGKGWSALGREFAKGLGLLVEEAEKINCTVLFIAHSKQSEIDAGSRTYSRIEVDLPGHARKILLPDPDHIWYLGFHSDDEDSMKAFESNRALWLQPTPVIEAGGRNPDLKTKFISPFPETGQYQHILKKTKRKKNGK